MKMVAASLLLGLMTAGSCLAELQLPEPPQQHKAWRADASVPANILSAAETLFAQGFPDPRGCEYREIEVEASGVWNNKSSLVKTRGWVLPKKSGTNHFAICWNGLIYPVANISAPADLHAEITNQFTPVTLTNKVIGTNIITTRVFPSGLGWRNNSAAGEDRTILFPNALSTRVLLLLRCGETAAALTNWSPNLRMMSGGGARPNQNDDPYLEFASDWAWAMFDRTICAHMRGDEALALATARPLAEVQPKIEAECARRGFSRQSYYDYQRRNEKKPYLEFLEQLPQLLADLERREKEGPRVSAIQSGLQHFTNQTERIAALICDLDLVQAHQWGQPGGVNLADDAVVSAIIQEGDAAVEPLLDCLTNDHRLTRSVVFGRDFFRGRTIIPVKSAAGTAAETILHAGFGGKDSEIRAYWNKYKNLKLEGRWYAILNDDAASSRWLEASGNIIQPMNVITYPGGFSVIKPAPTNAPVRLQGEVLRSKANPSISELMARRALAVPKENPNNYNISAACQMGGHLAVWDVQAAKPVAKTLIKRCCAVMKYSGLQLGSYIASLSLICADGGDFQPLEDYAAWLKTTTPEQLGSSYLKCLEPLCRFPTNVVLQSLGMVIFNDTNSLWSVLPWKGISATDPVESGLVNVPAFRLLLSRELAKTNICGSVSWRVPNWLSYQFTNGNGGRTLMLPESEQPADGAKFELRWCDWIAFLLSNQHQISPFNPFAPVEKRDDEIEAAKRILR